MNKLIENVRQMYAAFGRGDVGAILEHIDADVAWDAYPENFANRANVPWLTGRKGRQGVAAFFEVLRPFTFNRFEVHRIMGGEDAVAAEVSVEIEHAATNLALRDDEMHLFTFNAQGRVVRFRHFVDTAKHIDFYEKLTRDAREKESRR